MNRMLTIIHTLSFIMIAGCSVPSSNYNDVWENYDVRDVAPQGGDYSQYEDNDNYYTPPITYGCSPQDIGSIGCE
jgi:hypothetical protein